VNHSHSDVIRCAASKGTTLSFRTFKCLCGEKIVRDSVPVIGKWLITVSARWKNHELCFTLVIPYSYVHPKFGKAEAIVPRNEAVE
jgi:hypothetical protein